VIARRIAPLLAAGGLLALLSFGSPTGASQPYNPTFELISISNSAAGATADVTIRTSLPAGSHILGNHNVEVYSWNVAGHSNQLNGEVTAVATMAINLEPDGNCNDGDSGSPQTYGPVPLLDQDPGGGGPHAEWFGILTDFADGNPNTNWGLLIVTEPSLNGYILNATMTDAVLPAGYTVCTPQTVTFTFCGRANPTPTATTCGADQVVMTNPSPAGCYTWELRTRDPNLEHMAIRKIGISIGGTPCDNDGDGVPDPSDNCPLWWNPAQNAPPWFVPPNDPDCDGFGSALEIYLGTNHLVQCGVGAWPADTSDNTFSDTLDLADLTSNFGDAVPADAPDRFNLAPDPPQAPPNFIDTLDIAKMTSVFGLSCAPCSGDMDCDLVANASDNCPNWPNPAQNDPPWPVPPGDPDCDGFSTALENYVGTNPTSHCGTGAWPSDTSNNGFVDTLDIADLTSNFGDPVPAGAPVRFDLAPDPPQAPPNFIDTLDIAKMTSVFSLGCG